MDKIYKTENIDEERLYKYLKKINMIIEDCEHMEIDSKEESSFDYLFPLIVDFLWKVYYNDTFKYKKDLQNKINNDLWKKEICSLRFRLI